MNLNDFLFRGKITETGVWVEGVAFPHDNGRVTMFRQHPMDGSLIGNEVDPDTVGRYSGLSDINGTKIFEGDLVKLAEHDAIFEVRVVDGSWECRNEQPWKSRSHKLEFDSSLAKYEVVGSIHNNPNY